MSRIIKSTRFIRITPDTCRICLRDLQRNLLKDLHEYAENLQEIEPKTLAELYETSTGYKTSEPPGSPSKICLVCEANLVKLYTFKQEVHTAEASLIQLLQGHIKPCFIKEEEHGSDSHGSEDHHEMNIEQLEPEHHLEEDNLYMEPDDEGEIHVLDSSEYVISNEPEIVEERLEVELQDDSLQSMGAHYDKTTSESEEKFAVRMITLPEPDMIKRRLKKEANNDKAHECQMCPMKFKTATQLRQHLVTHSDERNFECSICFKRFKTRKTLKGHEEIHSTSLSYVCMVCNHGYSNKTALRVHYARRHGLRKLKTTLLDQKAVLDLLKDDIDNSNKKD